MAVKPFVKDLGKFMFDRCQLEWQKKQLELFQGLQNKLLILLLWGDIIQA